MTAVSRCNANEISCFVQNAYKSLLKRSNIRESLYKLVNIDVTI